jgi:hypothetical protein
MAEGKVVSESVVACVRAATMVSGMMQCDQIQIQIHIHIQMPSVQLPTHG